MRQFIPKDNYVWNKDKQDLFAALKLSDKYLINHLHQTGYFIHSLIPRKTRYTAKNRTGINPCPIDVFLEQFGFNFMLTYDATSSYSKIYRIELHNLIIQTELLKEKVYGMIKIESTIMVVNLLNLIFHLLTIMLTKLN